jgi:hypothetical protein
MPDLLSILWWRKFYSRVGRGFGWGCAAVIGVPLIFFGWNTFGSGGNRSRGSDENGVIATVNGEPVTQAQVNRAIPQRSGSGAQGAEQTARAQGAAMNQLAAAIVVKQLAKKYNVKVNDADIDRKIAEEREQRLGKTATDADWEQYVSQAHGGLSQSEYRDSLATDTEMLGKGLLDKFKERELVTPDDVKNYNQEVRLRIVQIGYGRQPFADPKHQAKVLTEAEARTKAEDLLAKAKSGADLAAIAKANSTDFTKSKGGDLGFMPEFRTSPSPMGGPPAEMLASSYGKDLADAVHKTPTGQLTGVVKTSAFGSTGFAFARVDERRDASTVKPDPKNPTAAPPVTDPKKIVDQLKQERASEKLGNEFKAAFKAANIVFRPNGADEKAYYDYAKLQEEQSQAEQARMMAQFGQPSQEPIPTPAELQQKRVAVDTEIESLQAKHPEDPTLALLAARIVKTKMDLAASNQKGPLRDQLIALYQTALKGMEDRDVRFELAELYRDKGDTKNAEAVLQKISRLMDIAPGFDTQTLTEQQTARKRLVTEFRSIDKPEEAAAEQEKLAALEVKLIEAKRKAALEQKGPQLGGALGPGRSTGGTLTMPPLKRSGAPAR